MTPRPRVFFALWPDLPVRAALAAAGSKAQTECGGRVTPLEKLHVTVFFAGEVEHSRLGLLQSCGAAVRAPAFDLDLDVLGYWRHNRLVWAGVRHCPASLGAIAAQLGAGLALAGFAADDRPYVPHVTLVRNAGAAPSETRLNTPLWKVAELALVESVRTQRGARYDVLERWSLAPQL